MSWPLPLWVSLIGLVICVLALLSAVCSRTNSEQCWRVRDYLYLGVRDVGTWRGIVAVLSVFGARVADLDLLNMVTVIGVALGLLEIFWPSERKQ